MFHMLEVTSNYVMWCYGKAVGCKVVKIGHFRRCVMHRFAWDTEPIL